ncbi:transmembrane protein 177 isoform X1 [Drosophila elegans]|uniref:transmembrane protein 177 isoform X1 n=1 Tax=Drosophila elegans TaxID=30023 RepID=UPI0007E6EAE0|nr:transmembrane protein 177 isoform X1 [Drosophila elegans]
MQPKLKAGGGLFSYFKTEKGRRLVFYGAGVTTVGLFVGNFLPHTFGLKYYRDFVQCYQHGVERAVPEAVQQRLEKALDQLGLTPFERKFVKPFTVFGFDLFQAGTTKLRFGGALGIPVNYGYGSPEEIKRADIRFRDQQIDWSSPSGKLLEQAIVLNEDEQIFGLSKSVLQLQTHQVLLNSIFPSVSFLMVYTMGTYLNLRLNLFARHGSVRFVLYSILGLFGLGLWSFMKDYNQVATDAEIDKRLASMGPQFVAAGVGFYDKHLKKNIALRDLIGDNTYTALGNENYMLRQKSMPLTARKSFFLEKIDELNKVQEPETQ